MPTWRYSVKGYGSAAHPAGYGALLLHTTHSTESSRDVEISAWKSRMERGEVAYIEVLDHVNATTERISR